MVFGSILVGKFFKKSNKLRTIFVGFATIGGSLLFMSCLNLIPQGFNIVIPKDILQVFILIL